MSVQVAKLNLEDFRSEADKAPVTFESFISDLRQSGQNLLAQVKPESASQVSEEIENSIKKIEGMKEQFEKVPNKERRYLSRLPEISGFEMVSTLLETYNPKASLFYQEHRLQNGIDDRGFIRAARDSGLAFGILDWCDRETMKKGTGLIFLTEGETKEKKFEIIVPEDNNAKKYYNIPVSTVAFYDGKKFRLGVKTGNDMPSSVWTSRERSLKGESFVIPDSVSSGRGGVFASGFIHALRARELTDLIGYYEHGFSKILADCVALSEKGVEGVEKRRKEFSPYKIGCRDYCQDVRVEDPEVRPIVARLPSNLEAAIDQYKAQGFFFDPTDIRTEIQRLNVPTPDRLETVLSKEEQNMREAENGIDMLRMAVEQSILNLGLSHTMVDMFYTLVKPETVYGMAQFKPGKDRETTVEGYFLVGQSDNAEVTLSYARNSNIDKNRKLKRWFHFPTTWFGSIAVEKDSSRFMVGQKEGPIYRHNSNEFGIVAPKDGYFGTFSASNDRMYEGLFSEMAKIVSPQISMINMIRTPIG